MSVYKKQIGGSHYKDMKIQPSEFINKNKLLFAEGNAIKYICRHAAKGEVKDLEKAKDKIETAWNHAGTEMRYVKRAT